MKIYMTLQEILDKGIWKEVSNMKGYDYYAPREGMRRDFKFCFTEEEANKLGLL